MSDEKSESKKTKAAPKPLSAPRKEEFKKIIRIAEADLDGNKKVEHALTAIKGVSWAYAHAIRKVANINNVKFADLPDNDVERIKQVLAEPQKFGIPTFMYNRQKDVETGKDAHILSSDLVLVGRMDIRRLRNMRCYRGIRHNYNYKVRGQRTRSRGANVKGRQGGTVGVIKRKLAPAAAGDKKGDKKGAK
jgi:small subunit ribosomal protein S13